MKKTLHSTAMGLAILLLSSGCLNLQLGGGTTSRTQAPTVGQQLIDLQKAKEAGVIDEAEYKAERSRVLGHK
jgi:hypothetical protein